MNPPKYESHSQNTSARSPLDFLPFLPPQVNGEELYIVVNAGCRDKDLEHIGKHLKAFQVQTVWEALCCVRLHPHWVPLAPPHCPDGHLPVHRPRDNRYL